MSTQRPARVASGAPTGGQFAASARPEAAVALAPAPPDAQSTDPGPQSVRYDSMADLAAAGYVTDEWRRWQQGGCAAYAVALVDRHPNLRFAVLGRTELGGGDASAGWSETHCFAHDDEFAYDSAGRHPLPYRGVEGTSDYVEMDADPDDYGYRDEFEAADFAAARNHAERHGILRRHPVPLGGVTDRREAYPLGSPAALVTAFQGKPVGQWVDDQGHPAYIAPNGAYVTVSPDTEDTGHWFIDGVYADGSYFDGGCLDSKESAKRVAPQHLTGPASYR